MADVMLTPALLLLLPAPANDAWVERLDFPNLVQADLNLAVRDEDLGLRGFDLGFPDDPRVRVREARARVDQGDRTSGTLHQAASGLVAIRDLESFKSVMPACLEAYMAELEATPEDVELRVRFAKALLLAGTYTHLDAFFRDAGIQLATAARANPEDWRVLDEHAKVLAARTLLSRVPRTDPVWLAHAAELATHAMALAPNETAPRWRRFYTSHLALVRGASTPEEGLFVEMASLADGLAAAGKQVEDPNLVLVGNAYWFVANLAPVLARFEGRELPAPADAETIVARLAAFEADLRAAPAGQLRVDVARAWWTLDAFLGDEAGFREDMDLAIELGVPALDARILALMGLHRRGAAEAAAQVAAELAESVAGYPVWRALTVYRQETGDFDGAFAAQAKVVRPDPALRLARAQLRLRAGQAEVARDELKDLIGELAGTPLAGAAGHTYGVALALTGDVAGAKLQLSVAARLLGEEAGAGARATLEELR